MREGLFAFYGYSCFCVDSVVEEHVQVHLQQCLALTPHVLSTPVTLACYHIWGIAAMACGCCTYRLMAKMHVDFACFEAPKSLLISLWK